MFLLEAWYSASSGLPGPPEPPQIAATWAALHPASADIADQMQDLRRSEEWLELAQTLTRHDPRALAALDFPDAHTVWLRRLGETATQLTYSTERDQSALARQILERLHELVPESAIWDELQPPRQSEPEDPWWTPQDIEDIPTMEPVTPTPPIFTREEIDEVLSDL
jgi:hypothetical protein